jgi:hypothetical protein
MTHLYSVIPPYILRRIIETVPSRSSAAPVRP